MPFFSVIIPLYNKEAFIEDTIKSVLNQSFEDFEVIIINDGSTDRSLEVAKSINDKRIRIFNTENSGLSLARNLGIKNAATNFITFIDADDLWHPNHLIQLNKLIQLYPGMGMYCSGYTLQKSNYIFQRAIFNDLAKNFIGEVPDFFNHSLQNCVAWISAICIPKMVFNDIGDFDPEIFSEQDTDLYIRIALKYKVALNNTTASAIYNRINKNSMSSTGHKKMVPKLFYAYKSEEATNPSLKKYMDYNRFSFVIHYKLNKNIEYAENILSDIDPKNLTYWQFFLTKLPSFIINFFFFIKRKFHLSTTFIFKPTY